MSEKKYFDFTIEEDSPPPSKPENEDTDEIPSISQSIEKIKLEIQKMQDGTSDLRSGSLLLSKGQCPATVALERLRERPGKKNLINFLMCSKQDFGERAYRSFKDEISKQYLEVLKLNV